MLSSGPGAATARVKEKLLTAPELAEYRRLQSELAQCEQPPTNIWHPAHRPGIYALLVWVFGVGLLVPVNLSMNTSSEPGTYSTHGSSSATTVLLLSVFAMLGGIVVVFIVLSRGIKAWQRRTRERAQQRVSSLVTRVEERLGAARNPDDGGPVKPLRQRQHEWYGDHTELNWRDRELAEVLGLSADEYVSNYQGD